MKVELRAHRESYNLDVPFELYIEREELLRAYRAERQHCWLELSTLVRMLALLFDAQAPWRIRSLDQIAAELTDHPEYPGVTLSALPPLPSRPAQIVFDCADSPLPCIVAGYDAVIERQKRRRDIFWEEDGDGAL